MVVYKKDNYKHFYNLWRRGLLEWGGKLREIHF